MKSTFGDRVGQRTIIVFVFLVLLCAFLFFAEIFSGSVKVSVRDLFEILFLKNENSVKKNIFFLIRLPRTLMAFLLGGALSVSGFLLQTYFQNPIAGPFVLGISSGSRFCVSLCLLLFFKMGLAISSVSLVLASFVGAILVSFIMLLFSKKISGSASLLVAGLMSSYIFSGLSEGVSAFADDSHIATMHRWASGSFSGMKMEDFYFSFPLILFSLIFTFLLSKRFSAYRLGESYARTLGVPIKIFRTEVLLLSSILSSCVTAFAGPISFVGVAVPFLTKRAFASTYPKILIPGTFLGGSAFCLFCDIISRTIFAPTELPLGVVTSLCGSPIVLFMLVEKRNGK